MEKHSHINREFVTYEIASELKELGFDEMCFGYFARKTKEFRMINGNLFSNSTYIGSKNFLITAPIWQQAIRWFYEKHNIFISPNYDQISGNQYWCGFGIKGVYSNAEYDFSDYNEAVEFGILKGIEILKEIQWKK